MIEQEFEIGMPDGMAGGLLYQPAERGDWPGVILFTDIGGIRASQRAMAARLCSEGYVVLMPNLFYRTGSPPFFEPGAAVGDEKFAKRREELSSPLTPQSFEQDASTYVDFFAHQQTVRKGLFGVIGLCFAGALMLRMAAVRPVQIASGASFHGSRLCTHEPTSPHLLLPEIKAHLYFGHAAQDNSMPQSSIENFNHALQTWGGKYQSEVYDGTRHGWTVIDNPVYNPPQAERAFNTLKRLFAETLLGQSPG